MNKTVLGIVVAVFIVAAGVVLVRFQKTQTPRSAQTETSAPEQTGKDVETTLVNTVSQIALNISSPAPGTTVRSAKLTVKGKTAPRAEVFINDAEGVADASGNFTVVLTLDEGENPIVVTAVDPDGNVAEKDFTVMYETGE